MSITTISSREFNQDVSKAKRAAEPAPSSNSVIELKFGRTRLGNQEFAYAHTTL